MSAALEIDVHFCDGSVRSFRQDDDEKHVRIQSRLDPQRVFDESMLVIGDDQQVGTIRTSAVLRIEVRGPRSAEWTFGHGIESVTVVDEAAFLAAPRAVDPSAMPRTGDPFVVHAEMRDVCGGRLFLQVEGAVMPEAVRVHRLERIMQRPCMLAQRADDHAVLIQLSNVACFTVRPVIQLPPKAIEAAEVRSA